MREITIFFNLGNKINVAPRVNITEANTLCWFSEINFVDFQINKPPN